MSQAQLLIDELVAHNQTISFCESLTAGLACATVADVPGASQALRGGLVTYATDLKASVAGVSQSVLDDHGVISPETAREMARGVRRVCGSTWGVSLTGVAGPDEQDGHPVGEVYIGISGPAWTAAWPAGEVVDPALAQFRLSSANATPIHVLTGSRDDIRKNAVAAAINGILRVVREQK
ncbi:CinA family protein [Corynebacterium breve]|uniref:CinA family protein n=1 Tax=Corynebacterium breve TaxID=3049799 RepID=A0ABY8VBK8_9CORY|nr:CinA family protein [Corynebacterium breve]WIM66809.1 CinA family protein [Corynebacterium breve]